MAFNTIQSGIWLHKKGHRYLVVGLAWDSNNLRPREEPQVVYISLEGEGRTSGPMHHRSLSEFLERFQFEGGSF